MAYAYRRARGAGHPLLTGMSIGLLLGLALALGVAVYLYRVSPFDDARAPATRAASAPEKPKPPPAGMPTGEVPPAPVPLPDRTATVLPGPDPLDMLPHPGVERSGREAPTAMNRPVYFLQVGSFQRAEDADNLKAQLALWGLEASIVTVKLDGKGVWHRVRLGPFADQGSLQSARASLRENRVESTVITVTAGQLRNAAQARHAPNEEE